MVGKSLYMLRMGGSDGMEKQSESRQANKSGRGLPKRASAGFGGSPAIRLFTTTAGAVAVAGAKTSPNELGNKMRDYFIEIWLIWLHR